MFLLFTMLLSVILVIAGLVSCSFGNSEYQERGQANVWYFIMGIGLILLAIAMWLASFLLHM